MKEVTLTDAYNLELPYVESEGSCPEASKRFPTVPQIRFERQLLIEMGWCD